MTNLDLEREKTTDIPITPDTSSVGALVWPPTDASENRLKGIYPEVVEDARTAARLFTDIAEMPFASEKPDTLISRISARALITEDAFREMIDQEPELAMQYTEGLIPLAGTIRPELDDLVIVYMGKNAPERKIPDEEMQKRIDGVTSIYTNPGVWEFIGEDIRYDKPGFDIGLLTDEARRNPDLIRQYATLYAAFQRSEEDVRSMLELDSNIHVSGFVRGDSGENILISAGIAELAQLKVTRKGEEVVINFAEITEAATNEDYRGRGIYTVVANHLNRECARLDLDFAMAESNSTSNGVLVSARRQGRQTSLQALEAFGLPPRLLEQHVRIFEGSEDNRPVDKKNDLVPTYMTRDRLQKRYGA